MRTTSRDDIGRGTVDVVVTEGFSGNIALKAAEGTARQIAEYLRAAMSRTLLAKIGYILAKGAFDRLREKMDPRKVNGGVFLGLNGVVIKSHGGADAEGFAAAIDVGYDMVKNGLKSKIELDLAKYHGAEPPQALSAGMIATLTILDPRRTFIAHSVPIVSLSSRRASAATPVTAFPCHSSNTSPSRSPAREAGLLDSTLITCTARFSARFSRLSARRGSRMSAPEMPR